MTPADNKPSGNRRGERATGIVAREAAQFIAREAGSESLITVVRVRSFAHSERMTVFVSVFPDSRARAAIMFLERQREAFSDYLKSRTRLHSLPRIEFMLDDGSTSGGPGGN